MKNICASCHRDEYSAVVESSKQISSADKSDWEFACWTGLCPCLPSFRFSVQQQIKKWWMHRHIDASFVYSSVRCTMLDEVSAVTGDALQTLSKCENSFVMHFSLSFFVYLCRPTNKGQTLSWAANSMPNGFVSEVKHVQNYAFPSLKVVLTARSVSEEGRGLRAWEALTASSIEINIKWCIILQLPHLQSIGGPIPDEILASPSQQKILSTALNAAALDVAQARSFCSPRTQRSWFASNKVLMRPECKIFALC